MKLTIKRLLAFAIDYLIIILYGTLLFLVTISIIDISKFSTESYSPIKGQFIGFFTMTLPVFMYNFLLENSQYRGGVGKQIMRIAVIKSGYKKQNIFIRNFVKFLPWEIGHLGVHWAMYYSSRNQATPNWVWVVLILPQIIMVIYFTSLILSKGESSFYDKIAHSKLTLK